MVLLSAPRCARNLLSLQKTNFLLDATQLRLATGRKVNSALDNPLSFFTAQALTNRSNDLGRLLDSMGQSIQSVKEADKGVTTLTSLLEQAQATVSDAQEALAGGVNSSISGTVNIGAISDLNALLANGANNTFNISVGDSGAQTITIAANDSGQDLVDNINTALAGYATASLDEAGRLKLEPVSAGDKITFDASGANDITAADFAALGLGNFVAAQDDGAAGTVLGGTVVAGTSLRSTALAGTKGSDTVDGSFATLGGQSITFGVNINGTTSINVTIDSNTTIDQFVASINENVNNTGLVTASFNEGSGQISLKVSRAVDNVTLSQTPSAAGPLAAFGFAGGLSDQQAADTAIRGEYVSFAQSETLDKIQTLEDNYNELRKQIDAIVDDANYRGVNLLGGDTLTTYFNEDRSNKLTTVGQNLTAAGLGLVAADFGTAQAAQSASDDVRGALSQARDFGSQIANSLAILQTREDFTKDTQQVLEEGADKLTLADQNEEGANMLALQTRLQLGVTSLSLAAQSQQAVLRLF